MKPWNEDWTYRTNNGQIRANLKNSLTLPIINISKLKKKTKQNTNIVILSPAQAN